MAKVKQGEGIDPETGSDIWCHEKEMQVIKKNDLETLELRNYLLPI